MTGVEALQLVTLDLAEIAAERGVTVRTVRDHLAALERAGYVRQVSVTAERAQVVLTVPADRS